MEFDYELVFNIALGICIGKSVYELAEYLVDKLTIKNIKKLIFRKRQSND